MQNLSLAKRSESTPARTGDIVPEDARPRCPFYGMYFSVAMRLMVHQDGNQCAIITDSYSPCRMDYTGQNTDWSRCPFNGESVGKVVREYGDSIRVFPPENALDSVPKEGLTLAEWMGRFRL